MRSFFALAFLLSSWQAFANPRVITHSRFYQNGKLVNGTIYGLLHLTGSFDPMEERGFAEIQFRRHSLEAWTTAGPSTHPISTSLRSFNFRRLSALEVPMSGFELRACYQGDCSVPYEFRPQPIFGKYILPSTGAKNLGYVTPFGPNLRFAMENHFAGNMKFQIGRLNTTGEIYYQGYVLADTPRGCPEAPPADQFACEVRIPDEIMRSPGKYVLTATSDYGTSLNRLEFDVLSNFKVKATYPDVIRIPIQKTLTFSFASDLTSPDEIAITMSSGKCSGHRLQPFFPGNEELVVDIPNECMPGPGCGYLRFEVASFEGMQTVEVPYNIR